MAKTGGAEHLTFVFEKWVNDLMQWMKTTSAFERYDIVCVCEKKNVNLNFDFLKTGKDIKKQNTDFKVKMFDFKKE